MMRSFGKLLVVAAGFSVYYLGISMIISWIVFLILTYVHHGSGAALLFTARAILTLSVIVILLAIFYRAIRRGLSKRGLLRHQPAVLALSRQPLPTLDRSKYSAASGVAKGAYVLADPKGGNPEVILIASGSELSLAVEAHEKLYPPSLRATATRAFPSPFLNQSAAVRLPSLKMQLAQ